MIQHGYRGMEDNNIDPNKYGIDYDGPIPEDDDTTIVVDEPRNILSHNQTMLLRSLVNPLEEDQE